MKMTLQLKSDILSLVEEVQKHKAAEGETWSDSRISTLCFGHGEYVHLLRKWDGGKGGPTLDKTLKFEQFCREQIGEKAYNEFRHKRRAAAA